MAKKQDRSEQYVRQVIPTHRLNIRTSRGAPSASGFSLTNKNSRGIPTQKNSKREGFYAGRVRSEWTKRTRQGAL